MNISFHFLGNIAIEGIKIRISKLKTATDWWM
jgi:hypothetical protein